MMKKTKEDGVDVKITKDDIQQQALPIVLLFFTKDFVSI
jgi:hypothetical protein